MSFSPFSFQLPTSSTSLSTGISSASPAPSNSSQFSTESQKVNNSLFCCRRRGQVVELNPSNFQLNLIDTVEGDPSASKFTPLKFLHTLKNWPSDSAPKRMICNNLGNLLAIQGSSGNISVLRLSSTGVAEEIEVEYSSSQLGEIVDIKWHPYSPSDSHLIILSKIGRLCLYDLLQTKSAFESEFYESENGNLRLLRLNEAEQIIKLPMNRTDPFTGISLLPLAETVASWLPFTAFLVKESGDIFSLCPFLPLKFRAQRQKLLMPLKRVESEPMALKWLDEVLLSCEFVASAAGDTDWVLCTSPGSFSHLQPRLQGPFLIQPEPMEIHHLSSYDRVVDFSVSRRAVQGQNIAPLMLATVAFGSGKIDFVSLVTEIIPKFQLKNSLMKPQQDDSEQLPIMALIESVDLKGSLDALTSRRSVDNRIKIINDLSANGPILVSTDSAVIRINLTVSYEDADEKTDSDEEEDGHEPWLIECNSGILIDKLRNHVLCISEGKIYPGAMKLELIDSAEVGKSSTQFVTSGILESITKFAFPLGKMEIESGAVQLEGLIENLMKNLQRLKSQRSFSSGLKLPEVDEIGATEFNDHVSEWQESLISPALRTGHEIALRSNELVQILRREREILVRAKTLLIAKPERLQRLLTKLSEAKESNRKLLGRAHKTSKELSKYSVYDEILGHKLKEISSNLSNHSLTKSASEFVVLNSEDELIQSQLLIQSEKLNKLKNQLASQLKQ